MNLGVPPTALNARTGEFTPPGVTAWARSKRAADACVAEVSDEGCRAVTRAFSPATVPDHESGPAVRAVTRATSWFRLVRRRRGGCDAGLTRVVSDGTCEA